MATKRTTKKQDQDVAAEVLGFTKGTKTYTAAQMYLRPEGATAHQIKEALGGSYRNMLKKAEADGHKVIRTAAEGSGGRKATAFRIEPSH